MNEPMGRLGSFSPARARRTARAIVSIASSWPMTRLCSASSIWSSRSDSSWAMRVTGMPVHIDDDLRDVLLVHDGLVLGLVGAASRCAACRCRAGELSRSRSSGARSYSWSVTAASFSLELRGELLRAALRSGGAELWRMRTRLAASSIRSIALSGR